MGIKKRGGKKDRRKKNGVIWRDERRDRERKRRGERERQTESAPLGHWKFGTLGEAVRVAWVLMTRQLIGTELRA